MDNRFKAAVPVYGCGFLHENSVWLPQFEKMTPEQRDRWVRLWDPSRYIGSAAMPVLFINGTNDFAYPLDSYAKTYGLVKSRRNLRITVNMPHGHPQGWAPAEIGLFVDELSARRHSRCRRSLHPRTVNDEVLAPKCGPGRIWSRPPCTTRRRPGPINKRQWQTVPGRIDGSHIVAPAPPPEATIWFLTVTDERGAVVSSELVFGSQR